LIEKSPEFDEALVVIRGFLSEQKQTPDHNGDWQQALKKAGWRGSIYQLWWDASSSGTFFIPALLMIVRIPLPLPHRVFQILGRAGISVTALLFQWKKIRRRAKSVGRDYLHDMLKLIPESAVNLMGFSLGALVVYYGLMNLTRLESPVVKNAILLGGTVERDKNKEWNNVVKPLENNLINVYNCRDHILKYVFRIAQLNAKSPCGLKPVSLKHPKIINYNATHQISNSPKNHWEHITALPNTIRWVFQRTL
jgi:hypothetical protein